MTDQDRIKELERENEVLKTRLAANETQPDTSTSTVTPSVPLLKKIAFLILLSLLSIAIYYCTKGYIIEVLTVLAIIIFGIGVISVIAFIFSYETFLWFIGKRSEYQKLYSTYERISTWSMRTAIHYFPIGFDKEEKKRIKNDVPLIVQMRVKMNQNEKIDKQNIRLDQQTYLQEAERRSSLVFLFSNIMDAVDKELKEDYGKDSIRNLSPQLIGRITGLSTRLKPYRYLNGDSLTAKPLSPERGQLLVSLLGSQLDTMTMDKIYNKADFSYADLEGGKLDSMYLKDVNLKEVNLRSAKLGGANLRDASLYGADLKFVSLFNTDLNNADLTDADLKGASLFGADLRGASLRGADLKDTMIKQNFHETIQRYKGKDTIDGTHYILKNYYLTIEHIDGSNYPFYILKPNSL